MKVILETFNQHYCSYLHSYHIILAQDWLLFYVKSTEFQLYIWRKQD